MSIIAIDTVCSWNKKQSDDMSRTIGGFRYAYAIMRMEGGGDDDDDDDGTYDYAPAA